MSLIFWYFHPVYLHEMTAADEHVLTAFTYCLAESWQTTSVYGIFNVGEKMHTDMFAGNS